MMSSRRRYAAPLAIALALAITPALSGCFANPIESIIEGATGGDVKLGGGLPEGFPTAEVPVISGDILYGAALDNADGKMFNVTIKVADASAIDTIKSQLEGAGFSTDATSGGTLDQMAADSGTYIAATDKWGVLVVVVDDGNNGFVANYTVSPASAQ